MTRELSIVRGRDVEAGDLIRLAETSSGIRLPREHTLVLRTRLDDHVSVAGDEFQLVWLQLDTEGFDGKHGIRPDTKLGTFLATDDDVEVWR